MYAFTERHIYCEFRVMCCIRERRKKKSGGFYISAEQIYRSKTILCYYIRCCKETEILQEIYFQEYYYYSLLRCCCHLLLAVILTQVETFHVCRVPYTLFSPATTDSSEKSESVKLNIIQSWQKSGIHFRLLVFFSEEAACKSAAVAEAAKK